MSIQKKLHLELNNTVQLSELAEGDEVTMVDIYRELLQLKSYLTGGQSCSAKRPFTNKTLSEFLQVSTRTLQTWRDEGKISFTQVKEVILYSVDDVELFMKKHRRQAFR